MIISNIKNKALTDPVRPASPQPQQSDRKTKKIKFKKEK